MVVNTCNLSMWVEPVRGPQIQAQPKLPKTPFSKGKTEQKNLPRVSQWQESSFQKPNQSTVTKDKINVMPLFQLSANARPWNLSFQSGFKYTLPITYSISLDAVKHCLCLYSSSKLHTGIRELSTQHWITKPREESPPKTLYIYVCCFFLIHSNLICKSVMLACISEHLMHSAPAESRRRHRFPRTGVNKFNAVSHHMGAGNLTHLLWSQRSLPLAISLVSHIYKFYDKTLPGHRKILNVKSVF